MAPAGSDGSFSDISQIPLAAIDHIEVLSDGASAIYGADAVAGVVNIITRNDSRSMLFFSPVLQNSIQWNSENTSANSNH